MNRIVITGVPRAGKSTLALMFSDNPNHTDDLAHLPWSEASAEVANWLLGLYPPYVIEGVTALRALRKALAKTQAAFKPCDLLLWCPTPLLPLTQGQDRMAKGQITIFNEIEPELLRRGVIVAEVKR